MPFPYRNALPLVTERLLLRPPRFDDVPRLSRLAADPSIAKNLRDMPYPFTQGHASAFVGDAIASNDTGDGIVLIICRKSDPTGMIGLISFIEKPGGAETGYWLGKMYRGKGFAQEACRAVIALAFRNPALSGIVAGAFADNPASLHLLGKLGFVVEREEMLRSRARTGTSNHIWLRLARPPKPSTLANQADQG